LCSGFFSTSNTLGGFKRFLLGGKHTHTHEGVRHPLRGGVLLFRGSLLVAQRGGDIIGSLLKRALRSSAVTFGLSFVDLTGSTGNK
jgi:hypothetical protein